MIDTTSPFAGLRLPKSRAEALSASRRKYDPSTAKNRLPASQAAPEGNRKAESGSPTYSANEYRLFGEASRKLGVEAERVRIAGVLGSKASRNRERAALELLATEDGTAQEIAAKLAAMPTDAERDHARATARQKAAASVWDSAIAKVSREAGA